VCRLGAISKSHPGRRFARREPDGRGRARGRCARSLAGGGGDRRKPALSPVRHCGQHRLESAAAGGESIAHPDRWAWIYKTFDKPFGLQLTQPLREHAVTNAGDTGKKLIESSRRRDQGLHDRPGPTLTYQLNGALKGRAVVEAPTDHGERFYAVSVVSETTRFFYFLVFLECTLARLGRKQPARRGDCSVDLAQSPLSWRGNRLTDCELRRKYKLLTASAARYSDWMRHLDVLNSFRDRCDDESRDAVAKRQCRQAFALKCDHKV
jgi:hypothetical protein